MGFWARLFGYETPAPAPPPEEPARVGFVGQPVAINPSDPQSLDRNTARVRRLEQILTTEARPERRESLLAELTRRRQFLPREG